MYIPIVNTLQELEMSHNSSAAQQAHQLVNYKGSVRYMPDGFVRVHVIHIVFIETHSVINV